MTKDNDAKGFRMTGPKVLAIMVTAFGTIIAVNLTLAYSAVSTFPGLEVQNSYIASQNFNEDLSAQQALGWDVSADVSGNELILKITGPDGSPAQVATLDALLGAATHVRDDQRPEFVFLDGAFRAPVDIAPGNWNIRLRATAADGTLFQQRVVLHVDG
ncbi:MAG: cbb3-type cytochrome c oxidase biogenesis protein CcoH [Roseibaca calidilacus]|uniref:Cbb3-type cytochrome c oxidase biogenesis protein CcoH n=1 Tax=Roseibaca calidilacus TaxID=1666912 RepID=A0A0P7WIL4_9RHOB|nr:FixH family protein [Roseibaca calidilacus]KPP93960.1 MAG: cbb3-type cytochrome c oxidase biogenesis protein CcoH [Roseibaca calidilacus]CUX79494.1 Nitrogen fixation protein FixH [Roseibaca calidilacus]